MQPNEIIAKLKALANPANVAGMSRFGISPKGTLGVGMPTIRRMAKEVGRDHRLALELWESGIHEARILAALVDDTRMTTEELMERWVADFESWDVCDQVCSNCFDKTPFAYRKAVEWAKHPEEFVRRAGFVLMAALSVHDKKASDGQFDPFPALIMEQATDERNFVKKAVNWALRQIGKRNAKLNREMIGLAERIAKMDSKSARWIAKDALRELRSHAVQARFSKVRQ